MEVEVSGAPEVSVPECTGGLKPLGWWWGPWHLLAWLRLLCLLCIWPGVTVITAHHCCLLSLISLPDVGLGPGQLGQRCTVFAASGTLIVG